MHRNRYRKFAKSNAWPFIAMMAASKGGWGSGSFAGGWDEEDWGGRRGRRRGRMFAQGELRLALLALIAEESRHGYELIKAIEELTGGEYAPSPGAVYPTLAMMLDEDVIEHADGDESRKAYRVTEAGTAELEERAEEVEALMERLGKHAERHEQVRSPDLFRAMGNLAYVLKNRARQGTLDKDVIEDIVDLVDELAKKIERL